MSAPREVAIRTTGRRTLGQWRGQVCMSDDFDAPLPDAELAGWLGELEPGAIDGRARHHPGFWQRGPGERR